MCISFESFCQNLVPNWNFEEFNDCPSSLNDLTVNDWFQTTTGTVDYFHVCGIGQAQIPSFFSGSQPPLSGNGFMGIVCYEGATPYSEYISVALTDTLVADSCYQFEMYVRLNGNSIIGIADIGVYFSETLPIFNTNEPLLFTPQITSIGGIISDTSYWTLISGSYQALGGETHLTIGNFNSYENTTNEIVNHFGYYPMAYYFIEDVSLTHTSSEVCDKASSSLDSVNVYPNPFSESLSFQLFTETPSQLLIYDVTLKLVLVTDFVKYLKLETDDFSSGVYIYNICQNGMVIESGRILKQ